MGRTSEVLVRKRSEGFEGDLGACSANGADCSADSEFISYNTVFGRLHLAESELKESTRARLERIDKAVESSIAHPKCSLSERRIQIVALSRNPRASESFISSSHEFQGPIVTLGFYRPLRRKRTKKL